MLNSAQFANNAFVLYYLYSYTIIIIIVIPFYILSVKTVYFIFMLVSNFNTISRYLLLESKQLRPIMYAILCWVYLWLFIWCQLSTYSELSRIACIFDILSPITCTFSGSNNYWAIFITLKLYYFVYFDAMVNSAFLQRSARTCQIFL